MRQTPDLFLDAGIAEGCLPEMFGSPQDTIWPWKVSGLLAADSSPASPAGKFPALATILASTIGSASGGEQVRHHLAAGDILDPVRLQCLGDAAADGDAAY